MGMKEFDSMLRKLIPATVSIFPKLEAGDPYHFDHWADDAIYYWFASKDGAKRNKKRVIVSELHSILQHVRAAGAFYRRSFETLCPISAGAGPCGFAVTGRILEALGVAEYSGHAGFALIGPLKVASILDRST
jgi:hypothetical protein